MYLHQEDLQNENDVGTGKKDNEEMLHPQLMKYVFGPTHASNIPQLQIPTLSKGK